MGRKGERGQGEGEGLETRRKGADETGAQTKGPCDERRRKAVMGRSGDEAGKEPQDRTEMRRGMLRDLAWYLC